ncbi:hypothetical protein GX51_03689 [Blastomyces parvus]|uniref:Uncharacterized protein n=1 Tax=Blastomyces parvus TaxID=2060905 RepID=A0A2B7X552_9EURO|nr:hypothetical protein GX51_03689 [Blastomyces parvus]
MYFTKDRIYRQRRGPSLQKEEQQPQPQPQPQRHRPHHQPGMFTFQPLPLSSQEIDIALQHAQQAVQPPPQHNHQPYFPGILHQSQPHPFHPLYSPPFSGADSISTSPFTIATTASNNGSSSSSSNHHHHLVPNGPNMSTQEHVRRTNLAAALANGIVSPRTSYMQLHPMMCADGRFPADFQVPVTVEGVLLLDNTQLDRILQDYKLYSDARSLLLTLPPRYRNTLVNARCSTSRFRQAKLHILLEYLGAVRIVEDRSKRAGF